MNKLVKLSLIFLVGVGLVSFVVTPSLLYLLEASTENIKELQTKSLELGSAQIFSPKTLQKTITEGAKSIKSQLERPDYLFIYCSQIAYNILCFLISALIFRKIAFTKQSTRQDWTKTNINLYFLAPLLLLTTLPVIGESLHLNEWLGIDWLIKKTGYEVNGTSIGNMIFSYAVFVPETELQLCVSIIFVAIIPAIGEELFFRGSLQKTLGKKMGNIHNTIFVTALIFSAMHFEITAFFYRFFLGVILGYTFYWTKNLMIPMLIHALNNGMTVFTMYYTFNGADLADIPDGTGNKATALVVSTLSAGVILWVYYSFFKKQQFE